MPSALRSLQDTTPVIATVHRGTRSQLVRFGLYLLSCLEVARQRHHLLTLDEHMINDIGIRPMDISREVSRSFWDIPNDQNAGR